MLKGRSWFVSLLSDWLTVELIPFLARIKAFNMRFRAKHFAGDSSVVCPTDEFQVQDSVDPRGSPAFIELDHLASSFNRANFPQHLRTPITDNVVDSHLYTAFLLPHV